MSRLSIILPFLLFVFFNSATAQIDAPKESVIAEVDGESIILEDLIRFYQNNTVESGYTADDLQEFLPYYINFIVKLKEAEERNYLEEEELQSELSTYSQQAAFAWWSENKIRSEMLSEFRERSEHELKAFHILKRLPENAAPRDTLDMYNALMEAKQKFSDGIPIEQLDEEYSTRTQGRSVGGQLPWISAGTTVKPFEDALYRLEPGEISDPVRTQFGYHLILLQDKRPRSMDREVRHIFFAGSGTDGNSRMEEAMEAYTDLNDGTAWNEVVQDYTEDMGSRANGGRIGWVGYGMQFAEEFVDKVMNLNTNDQFSEPVQTNYGVHIFKVDSVRTYPSPEARDRELMERLQELPRFSAGRDAVLELVKEAGEFKTIDNNESRIEKGIKARSLTPIHEIELTEYLKALPLVEIYDMRFNGSDYWEWLRNTYPEASSDQYNSSWFSSFSQDILVQNISELTVREFPEFKDQIQKYKEGLLVFRLSDDAIWNPETVDTTALKDLFEANRDRYEYDDRYAFYLIGGPHDDQIVKAARELQSGEELDIVKERYSEVTIVSDSVSAINDDPYHRLKEIEPGSLSEVFNFRNRRALFYFLEVLPARKMTFDEAFYRVLADYQPVQEEVFSKQLRDKYSVTVYPERIK